MGEGVSLRPSLASDLPWITALERRPDNVEMIGQWTDAEHLDAIAGKGCREHWVIERDGEPEGFLIAYDCSAAGAGVYVKRVLVDRKEQGTGTAALESFLEIAFARPGVDRVWLIVRNHNARAQAVYGKLGFVRVDDASEEARRYDAVAEAPPEKCFRMRKLGPGPSPQ
jgi:ribosomal protein S18 acetylase RimI-like enzyme